MKLRKSSRVVRLRFDHPHGKLYAYKADKRCQVGDRVWVNPPMSTAGNYIVDALGRGWWLWPLPLKKVQRQIRYDN